MADRVVSPRWVMLFFEILPFTYKNKNKNDAASLGVHVSSLDTPKNRRVGVTREFKLTVTMF